VQKSPVKGRKAINTNALFLCLLRTYRADCVCDIGSRDGKQAALFRSALPDARVLAFEASPQNYQAMADDPDLKRRGIEVFNLAVCNRNGHARFYVDQHVGMGSILRSSNSQSLKEVVEVETVRLDAFFTERAIDGLRIGLWIDVEGAGFEVLEGLRGMVPNVGFVHIEVENFCMRDGQKKADDVYGLLDRYGLEMVATSLDDSARRQGDAVFVSRKLLGDSGRVQRCLSKAQWIQKLKIAEFSRLISGRRPYQMAKKAYSRYFG
jgi:FkbM family methyltransferase